jgi:hypothetical protein
LDGVGNPLSGVSLRWNPDVNQRTEERLERGSLNSLVLFEFGSGTFGPVNLVLPHLYLELTVVDFR